MKVFIGLFVFLIVDFSLAGCNNSGNENYVLAGNYLGADSMPDQMNIRCEGQQVGKVINSGMGLHLQIMDGFRIFKMDTLIHRQNIIGDPFIEIIKSNNNAGTVYLNNDTVFINASKDFKPLDSVSKKIILNQLNNTMKVLDSILEKDH